jgi:hypothetical protein
MSMKNEQALAVVQRALEVLERNPDSEDEEGLMAVFCEAGFEAREAAALSALLPVAFGRAALQQMGATVTRDDAYVSHFDGTRSEFRLSDQPIYKAAVQIAVRTLHHGTTTPAAANKLVRWGAEFKGLASLIARGEDLNKIGYSGTFFYGYDKDVFNKPPWWRRRLF